MDKEINKECLQRMLISSLESAGVLDEKLEGKVKEFHEQLGNDESISDLEEYNEAFNELMTDYLFLSYRILVLTDDEQVVGIKGDSRIILFDATDMKPHLDLI
jgi:hypothetical protein